MRPLLLLTAALAAEAQQPRLPYHYRHPGRLDHSLFRGALRADGSAAPDWQRRTRSLVASAEALVPLYRADDSSGAGAPGVVSPADFGGDATGQRDSTQAFASAIAKLTELGGGRKNGANQTDLGGATLSLGGGVWAISQPVSIPAGYANYRIEDGTIIAHESFGSGSSQCLLELGGVCGSATAGLSKNCATDISVSEVTLDGRDRAWGGVAITSAVNVNIGPQVMVIGFQGVGIKLRLFQKRRIFIQNDKSYTHNLSFVLAAAVLATSTTAGSVNMKPATKFRARTPTPLGSSSSTASTTLTWRTLLYSRGRSASTQPTAPTASKAYLLRGIYAPQNPPIYGSCLVPFVTSFAPGSGTHVEPRGQLRWHRDPAAQRCRARAGRVSTPVNAYYTTKSIK